MEDFEKYEPIAIKALKKDIASFKDLLVQLEITDPESINNCLKTFINIRGGIDAICTEYLRK
ncbi:hypothetical protein JXH92_003671 [Salmonella enterica subsp. enterica serovar 4,[5],12:b:-]|nr:hypothetical protein [Salmonella enterica subsp. enterica serovar 4,[5],12:b:-]